MLAYMAPYLFILIDFFTELGEELAEELVGEPVDGLDSASVPWILTGWRS